MVVGVLAVIMTAGGALSARQSRFSRLVRSRPEKTAPAGAIKRKPAFETESKPRIITIFVHVSGAVARPGLYKIKTGLRTADGIAAAGGVTPEGDIDALNLASTLRDGQKIYVPRRGETQTDPGSEQKRLDLNIASAEELDGLDGIGPVLAKRIVDWRRRKGRFTSLAQLDEVEGIGAKKLGLIKDRLTLE